MAHVPGLRSPYDEVDGLVYFGRMLDKIRLHAVGKLPEEYTENLGEWRPQLFDARCCRFLGVSYKAIVERTLAGGTDEEVLAWARAQGSVRPSEDVIIWNAFMRKLGWRDDRSATLRQRIAQSGFEGRGIQTFFDLIECDEQRDPLSPQASTTNGV
ncbi:DUF5069 domain-containing protein [Congregicoccus parvus]|uniref:DUF5069 domain-containing protein n=1 Tax=Congregicoccus parvus TaxID=3081749 RepID=UPI003FA54F1A